MKRIHIALLVLIAILILAYSTLVKAQETVTGPVPWVTRIQGDQDSLLIRQPDTDWFEGTINTPFGEGDMVWQDKGGRSEIYLDRGSFVRLDENSGLVFDRLTDGEVRMVMTRGNADVGNGQDRGMLMDLPGHTMVVPPGAKANVRVDEQGFSTVTARRGSVDVEGKNGTVKVRPGQRLSMAPDGTIVRLERQTGRDAFDVWSDNRDQVITSVSGPPTPVAGYLPEPVAYEMYESGAWINDPYYGYVWQPRVAPDWAPYRAGKWAYRPGWGWTWVSYEPWGWYPYHYGRWVLVRSGWAWVPVEVRTRWSPALVFWVEGPDYIAWHPLPYGVSLAVVSTWSPMMVDRYICSRCITVVRYDDFRRCNYHHYVRPWPGTCTGTCRVATSPHRVVSSPVSVAHYRTSRPEGYVSSSRAPREQAVYAHHRPQGGRQGAATNPDRVSYGSATRPSPGHGVNSTASARNARPDQAVRGTEARGQPTGRGNAAARPAAGNRANPPGSADRTYGSASSNRGQNPAASRPSTRGSGSSNQGNSNVRSSTPSSRENPEARGNSSAGSNRPSTSGRSATTPSNSARPEARGSSPSQPGRSAQPAAPANRPSDNQRSNTAPSNRSGREAQPSSTPRSNPGANTPNTRSAPSRGSQPSARPQSNNSGSRQPASNPSVNRSSSSSNRGSGNVSQPASSGSRQPASNPSVNRSSSSSNRGSGNVSQPASSGSSNRSSGHNSSGSSNSSRSSSSVSKPSSSSSSSSHSSSGSSSSSRSSSGRRPR